MQITILAVGSAIGSGGILASSYALITKEEPLLPPFSTPIPHRFTLSLGYSLLFGVVVGMLIWGGDKIWQRYKNRQRQHNS
ncbi:MAG: intracellular growth attenuator family protein [Scytonema hyalinum WJT4-NPBG1]|nr:intracellular growth attenuator family protein [Scytonema hyalinum WJT4-NPBG1]